MKTDLFQSCGHCWVFQICWPIECSTFTASSFRIWKSSTGMPSPPLALFVVMLSKAHLTSLSRMSGYSRSVITPSWLSGSWRSFLFSPSGEWDDRGWDGWMASLTRWTWVWVYSGSWWWTGRPDILQFMGSQRVRHNSATELNWRFLFINNTNELFNLFWYIILSK